LNLLRTSILHPQISAAAHFHGLIDYNKTSFSPPGGNIIAHEKPSQRRTWAHHGHSGYSLVPAMHHYICKNVYITSTTSESIVETLEFPPHNSPVPKLSSTDRLLMTAHDMNDALNHPHPDFPLNTVGDDKAMALIKLSDFLKNKYNRAQTGFGNELGRLCQGIRDTQCTNTCLFVELANINKYRKITYGKLVCDYRPYNTEK
jgi:hypothetical protein